MLKYDKANVLSVTLIKGAFELDKYDFFEYRTKSSNEK